MKQPFRNRIYTILLFIFVQLVWRPGANAQDLPGFIPNIQTAPTGSLVLAMDVANQIDANTPPKFNLRVYGLAVRLLTRGYNLKWVIRTGKIKDGIDFTAPTERLWPSFVASVSRDFRGSALLLFPSDSAGSGAIINEFNNALPAHYRVKVYRLTAAVNVDIRYNLTRVPRIAVLSDGGNQAIHINYLTAAAVPTSNYTVFNAVNLSNDCFTFASEPHLNGPGPYLAAVRNYVANGGNFLAQCEAIATYENLSFGHYHSSTGMTTTNASFSSTVSYPNADMSFVQFDGGFNPSNSGTIRNWTFAAAGLPQNNYYSVIGNTLNPAHIGASVSKLTGGEGGLVFYIGNHTFNPAGNPEEQNGVRMYLNAMLTPSGLACNWAVWLLPAKVETFTAVSVDNKKNFIEWQTTEELSDTWYIIEHSRDGSQYTSLKKIDAGNHFGKYSFTHETPATGRNYYRIRIENTAGHISYTESKVVYNNQTSKILFNNPARDYFTVSIPGNSQELQSIMLADMTGKTVLHMKSTQPTKTSVSVSHLSNGTYIALLLMKNGDVVREKIIVNH